MPAPDPSDLADLQLLIAASRAAAELACGYWGRAPETWEKPDDAGPVTEADLAVDGLLHARLLTERPGYGWLSEESDASAGREDSEAVFIVDPIDGTRAFIDGRKDWAHALAVVRAGRVTAAVVHLPLRGKLYAAAKDGGTTLNGARCRVSRRRDLDGARLLAGRRSFSKRHWPEGVPDVTLTLRSSLAYRLALVAEGRFDGMLSFRDTWEWDAAAGALLVAEAGGSATDAAGRTLRFNNTHPAVAGVMAAPDPLHRALVSRAVRA